MPSFADPIVPVILALTLGAPAFAQPCPPLRIRNPDGNYIVPGVQGDIPYSGDLALDAYVHPGADRRPSVVVIHGGGLTSGSRVAHVGQILELLTRAGYNWFSVDYRLGGPERVDDALADIRSALDFIRCHAAELRVDSKRVILLGEDTGADLAALVAVERPAGVIGTVLLGGSYKLPGVPAAARDMPPLFVVHGGADSESPIERARQYCDAVTNARGRCRLLEVAGASHRSENWWPSQWGYKRELIAWLSALAPVRAAPRRPPSDLLRKDIVYGPSAQLKLDAYVPQASQPTPGVIIVHGGGWEAGDKVTYVTPLFEPLARAGLAWFSIDYRLTPAFENEDQLEDVRQAIRFLRAGHERFNIDPTRIVLIGESASGQMVAQVATESPRMHGDKRGGPAAAIAGVVSFYGVYDLPAMVTDASPRSLLVRLFRRDVLDDAARALLRRHSPLYRAHKDMPPVLLVNGTADRLWAQAQAFDRRLTDLGVRHEVIALEGAPHGMENWEGHPEWMVYKRRVVEWIEQVVRRP